MISVTIVVDKQALADEAKRIERELDERDRATDKEIAEAVAAIRERHRAQRVSLFTRLDEIKRILNDDKKTGN